MNAILLKPNREKPLRSRRPWVFSGAIDGVSGNPMPGETVDIFSDKEEWLGRGALSPESQITVRIWTFDQNETVDEDFFMRRIRTCVAARQSRWNPETCTAVRLIYGEGDGLPGLIVDRYANVLVGQFLTAGAERWKREIVAALVAACPGCSVFDRSDSASRKLEGLEQTTGSLHGEDPPEKILVTVGGLKFNVDVRKGHKTGMYLDQADTLRRIGPLAKDADVLDAFCYTGGFTMACLKGGAKSVTSIDASRDALDALAQNMTLNELDASRQVSECNDIFAALREYRDRRRTFDLIILDPPKFAETQGHVEKACRAYKDINLLALKLLNPGGKLATFSCSGNVDSDTFQKVVAFAALDAGRFVRVIERYAQAPDHPVALAFPEGGYLKGMLCDVMP